MVEHWHWLWLLDWWPFASSFCITIWQDFHAETNANQQPNNLSAPFQISAVPLQFCQLQPRTYFKPHADSHLAHFAKHVKACHCIPTLLSSPKISVVAIPMTLAWWYLRYHSHTHTPRERHNPRLFSIQFSHPNPPEPFSFFLIYPYSVSLVHMISNPPPPSSSRYMKA